MNSVISNTSDSPWTPGIHFCLIQRYIFSKKLIEVNHSNTTSCNLSQDIKRKTKDR